MWFEIKRYMTMHKLTTLEHIFLTENMLKILAKNRIITISDFLQKDTEKLSIISKLSLPQILDIRSRILIRYSAPLVQGCTLLGQSLSRKFVPTCIENLDTALEGGIPVGYITELCGLAGAGKTQICFQLAINCAKQLESSVLYMNTKGDFSAIRIQKILDVCKYTHKEMAAIMFKIKVVHVWCLEDAIQLLTQVKGGLINNLGLIIVDSLPCLMFQHLGDDNKIGLKLLNEFVNSIRFISKELEVGVVCVNIQTRWVDQDIPDIDDDDEPALASKESVVERRNRCLGKYWQHIPSTLLLIDKSEICSNKNTFQVQVQVFKSRLPKQSQQCTLIVNESGVSAM